LFVNIERSEARGAGQGMARKSAAVPQFGRVFRAAHECFIDRLADNDAAHRHHARCDTVREADHVRNHVIDIGRECLAETAKAAGEFVENQQNVVIVADRSQPPEIALGGRQDPACQGYWLNYHRRNCRSVVQIYDSLKRDHQGQRLFS